MIFLQVFGGALLVIVASCALPWVIERMVRVR